MLDRFPFRDCVFTVMPLTWPLRSLHPIGRRQQVRCPCARWGVPISRSSRAGDAASRPVFAWAWRRRHFHGKRSVLRHVDPQACQAGVGYLRAGSYQPRGSLCATTQGQPKARLVPRPS
jgi:hypothetical protein